MAFPLWIHKILNTYTFLQFLQILYLSEMR